MRTIGLTLLALIADPDFAGCATGAEPPGEPAALPVASGTPCEIDTDCVIGCTQARCVGFRCVESEPLDADRDGLMPVPCGDDCDDADPNAFPGASEMCDRRDDDCDGAVDEGAPPFENTFHVAHDSNAAVAVPWGDDILVLSSTEEGTIDAMKVATDGVSLTTQAVDLPLGDARNLRQVETGASDRHLFAYGADDGSTRYLVVQRTVVGAVLVEGPSTLFEAGDRTNTFELAAFGDSFAVHYQGVDPVDGIRRRLIRARPDQAPVHSSPNPSGPLALATDGTHLSFVDPETLEVVFIDASGAEVSRDSVGAPAGSWSPLASGNGVVYAFLLRARPAIVGADATGVVSAIATTTLEGDTLEFSRAGEFFIVAGRAPAGGSWTFDVIDDGGERLGLLELPTTEPVQRLSAVPWRDGVAVVAGLAQAFELGVITRCTAE